jgi:hypothetical protein
MATRVIMIEFNPEANFDANGVFRAGAEGGGGQDPLQKEFSLRV